MPSKADTKKFTDYLSVAHQHCTNTATSRSSAMSQKGSVLGRLIQGGHAPHAKTHVGWHLIVHEGTIMDEGHLEGKETANF